MNAQDVNRTGQALSRGLSIHLAPSSPEGRAVVDSIRRVCAPRLAQRVAPRPAYTPRSATVLRGRPASAGIACGRARLVGGDGPIDAVQPGDIVVCSTAVATWSPLLVTAAGFIATTGGVLSPLATVAREHSVPCVLGVGTGLLIEDGDQIAVDGSRGLVRVAARAEVR